MFRIFAILLIIGPLLTNGQDTTLMAVDSPAHEKFLEKLNFTRNLEFFQTLSESKLRCESGEVIDGDAHQYGGRIIRHINIEVLDPFGHVDPEALKRPKFFKLANSLHQTTTDRIIEQQLLFKEGEILVPELIVTTYQNLYDANYFRDVAIYIEEDSLEQHIVDVTVVVQDFWSWAFWAEADARHIGGNLVFNKFAGLPQRVTAGLGFNFDRKNPVTPKIWYDFKNIGGSFVDVYAFWSHDHYNYTYQAAFRRNFFSSEPQWAGGAQVGWYRTKQDGYEQQAFSNTQDFWLARSFPMPVANKEYMNFVLAGRIFRSKYLSAPEPLDNEDANVAKPFRDATSYLLGVGVANRRSIKETDLFDFFPYRYLPSGFNMHLVGGIIYNTDQSTRGYAGLTANHSLMTCAGYFQEEFSAGTFIDGRPEQIKFSIKSKYFTPRMPLGKWGIRQFVYQQLQMGLLRPEGESVLLQNGGVKGIRLRDFNGSSYYTMNLETVIYSPIRFMGFQARIFAFADIGLQGSHSEIPLSGARAYQAYGMGVRLNNWKLGMAFIELAFVYYPNTNGLLNNQFEFAQNFYNSKVIERNNLYSWEALNTVN